MRSSELLFLLLLFPAISALSQQNVDSLLAVDDKKVGFETAKGAYEEALALSIKADDDFKMGLSHQKLGELLDKYSEEKLSNQHFFKALEYFKSSVNTVHIGRVYRQIGNNYYQSGKKDSATFYVLKALDIAKEHGTKNDLMEALNGMANVYFSVKQYKKAIELYKEALEIDVDVDEQAHLYSNIALAYEYLGDHEKALKYVDLGLKACEISVEKDSEYLLLGHKSMIFLNAEELDSAEKYGLKALEYGEKRGVRDDLMVQYNRMGLLYFKKAQYNLAQAYYEKCLKVAQELKFERIHLIVANIAEAAGGQGDYKKAYDNMYRHLIMRDSLELLKTDKKFEDLLVKYQAVEKEQQIAILEQERLVQRVMVMVACIVLLALVILLIIYRQKIAATKMVAEKTIELNERKTRALKQENELKQIKARIEGQEKERLRIAKELHDSIAGNLAGIKLGLSRISENYSDDQAINQIKSNIDQTYNEVRSISTNLSPLKTSDFTFLEMVKRYVEGMSHLHGFELVFDDNTTSDLLSLTDELKLELYRVFQELINNIVKHSNATLVEISINELEDQLNVIIEDDGCGFDESQITEGMGLKNIASRVAILKGEFHIDSKPGRGTITNIDIPFLENNMRYA